jgi:hypothetical protein
MIQNRPVTDKPKSGALAATLFPRTHVQSRVTVRFVTTFLLASGLAMAQQTAADNPAAPQTDKPSVAVSGPKSAQWKGLSVKEKLEYDGKHFFDPENVVFAGIGASFDQLRERPSEWGEGWGSFGERYASHLGQYAVQRSIMFPVQAIDHEDTRFFRSTRTSYKGRLGDAFLHTVWRHDDEGGMMPAYSEFLGDYGAAAVSRFWWPKHYRTGSSIFIAGSDTVLIDAGINVFREFTPDIKRWIFRQH